MTTDDYAAECRTMDAETLLDAWCDDETFTDCTGEEGPAAVKRAAIAYAELLRRLKHGKVDRDKLISLALDSRENTAGLVFMFADLHDSGRVPMEEPDGD